MAVFICTLIFKISGMHIYWLFVYIYMCGRGKGVGWVGEVLLCGCVSERKRYMYGCMCVLIAVFFICV